MLELETLSILTTLEGWKKFGKEFNTSFFTSEYNQKLFTLIQEYWGVSESSSVERISLETLQKSVSYEIKDLEDRAACYKILKSIYDLDIDQAYPIVKKALIRWRAMGILSSAEEELSQGKLNLPNLTTAIQRLTQVEASQEEEESLDLDGIVEETRNAQKYPTGIVSLDRVLGGGFFSGEVVVLLGALFSGKSTTLTNFSCYNLAKSNPVLGFTCENSLASWSIRHLQNLLYLKREEVLNTKDIKYILEEKYPGILSRWNLFDCRNLGISTTKIRNSLDRWLEKHGDSVRPLVVVDQLVLGGTYVSGGTGLESMYRRDSQARFQLSAATEDLKRIAAEYEVAILTATQATRQPTNSRGERRGPRVLTSQDIAECLDIGRLADVVISLNQDEEERELGGMRLWLDKAREREITKRLFPVRFIPEFQSLEEYDHG